MYVKRKRIVKVPVCVFVFIRVSLINHFTQYDVYTYCILYAVLHTYRKVASSRPIYYSILDHFVQRLQYISIKIPLPSLKVLEFATNRDMSSVYVYCSRLYSIRTPTWSDKIIYTLDHIYAIVNFGIKISLLGIWICGCSMFYRRELSVAKSNAYPITSTTIFYLIWILRFILVFT